MLTEKTRQTVVTATAKQDDAIYDVEYRINNGKLARLSCNVRRTVQEPIEVSGGETQYSEREEYLGHVLNESGNIQISLREDTDIAPHLTVFNSILEEVKEAIAEG